VSAATAALTPAAEDLDEDRQRRDQHDQEHGRQQVRVDLLRRDQVADLLGQRPAGEDDAVGPQDAADDVPQEELPGRHADDAGDGVEEGAHDRDEPGEHHGLGRAELREVVLGLLDVLLLEDPRVGPVEHPPPVAGAQEVPELGAGDRADRRADEQQRQAHLRVEQLTGGRRRGDAGQEQQRVAREEEADEQPRLDEHDQPDADHAERAQQPLRIERVEGEQVAHGARLFFHGSPGYVRDSESLLTT
jgi:hypothetical protein